MALTRTTALLLAAIAALWLIFILWLVARCAG